MDYRKLNGLWRSLKREKDRLEKLINDTPQGVIRNCLAEAYMSLSLTETRIRVLLK